MTDLERAKQFHGAMEAGARNARNIATVAREGTMKKEHKDRYQFEALRATEAADFALRVVIALERKQPA